LGIAFTAVFCLAPFFYMLLTGLNKNPDFLREGKSLELTLAHFRTVIFSEEVHFLAYMRNSVVISAISATVTVFIASLAAYALTRLELPLRRFIMVFVLAISMFPPIALVGYLHKFMSMDWLPWMDTWINTYQALILPYVAWTLPLSLWILVSYFEQVPLELDKAGIVDGASRLQILVKIIFPVAAPGVFSTALLAFIFAFNEFLFALMLTTDYSARTIPVGIAMFQGLHGQIPWGEIMAASTVTTIPVVVLTLIFQRRIIQGLTRGAVKE
jgi:multiple sugar transport system permease protein